VDAEPSGSRSFPTLAERLARPAAEPERPPIAVWIDGDSPAVLARIAEAAPRGAFVEVIGGDRPVRGLDDLLSLLAEAPGADVVVVEPHRALTAAMLDELAAAAYADSVCATVSYLASAGTDPRRGDIPPPALDAPAWGLVYVRRDALGLALGNARAVDGGGAPGTASLRELLSTLLSTAGLVHRGLGAPARRSTGPSTGPMRVTIDVRHLAGPLTGAQVQSLSLVGALARTGEVELTALAPRQLHPSASPLVEPLRDRVAFSVEPARDRIDVFHLPHQVGSLQELLDCLALGGRFVLTHQDMIADRTPAYFASQRELEDLRRATRAALASADHVAFFSEHAALDAASDGALEPERATVVPLGVDHIRTDGPVEPPEAIAALGGRPFVLVVGTAFQHKNRLFALRVLRELVVELGWQGALVLVGWEVPWGSSVPEERRLLEREPGLRDRVIGLGHVSESEKRSLYRDAALVLFPSLYEGFGLIPFEAAAFGTPCLYARRGSVEEFLPPAGALPSDFAVPETASVILELLERPGTRDALVAEIRASGAALTWDQTARGYLEVYRRALVGPPRPLDREVLRAVGPDGIPLSAMERAVIRVYRRRGGFRRLVDSVVRLGGITSRTARGGRASRGPG
jgi:glycosyltransferase involved in cell wall biosynthesis